MKAPVRPSFTFPPSTIRGQPFSPCSLVTPILHLEGKPDVDDTLEVPCIGGHQGQLIDYRGRRDETICHPNILSDDNQRGMDFGSDGEDFLERVDHFHGRANRGAKFVCRSMLTLAMQPVKVFEDGEGT